jgi:hypothetical protein
VTSVAPANQVEQWEQKNPDNVHEVPVQADDFHGRKVAGRKAPPAAPKNQPEQQTHPDNHVHSVQPGHGEVKDEIDVSMLDDARS